MPGLNCAFVHVPCLYFDENNNPCSWINFSAMGLFPLCAEAKKESSFCEIIHLGIEKYLDKKFLLSDYVKKNDINFLAFSLHWYPQAYDVIETARVIKQKCPGVFISLGGFSASYYAYEILEKFPFINAIIKGEGEKPIRMLTQKLNKNPNEDDFSDIPNLTYIRKGKIIENTEKYNATSVELGDFTFFDPKLMKNFEAYSKIPYTLEYFKENALNNPSTAHGVTLGRGCKGNCAWCGGGFSAVKKLTGRDFISYRDIESVIREIKMRKNEQGTELFRFAFDPDKKDKTYVFSLFKKIKEEFKGEINIEFAAHSLPDFEFLELFKSACSLESSITLSPEFKDEKLRKKYKSFYYTNLEFEKILEKTNEMQIKTELYFASVPESKGQKDLETKEYADKLKNKFKNIKQINMFDIEVEPASFWTLHPEKFGLKLDEKRFIDYYNDTKKIENSFENEEIFIK